jgi:chorismate--pyruvate lyase
MSNGTFTVTVLKQEWHKPRRDEAMALGIPFGQYALIREVVLSGQGQPWVFARSVLPLSVLHGKLRFLRKLDNRPLGGLLFKNRAIRRGSIFVSQWPCAQLPETLQTFAPLSASHSYATTLWARYSIFHHESAGLMVSEVFLPALSDNTIPLECDT